MTDNARIENVNPFPWIGYNFKSCLKGSDWSKFPEI